jgi:hypothetical protein
MGLDWPTAASLATAGGTLVLAVATFAAVRSANNAARTAERSLLAGLRPLLLASRPQDPPEKMMWQDRHFAHVAGGTGVLELSDDVLYVAMGLRNAGPGIAIIHGWFVSTDWDRRGEPPVPTDEFRRTSRDLYIPAGETGFWQAAIRDLDDPWRPELLRALKESVPMVIDLLYGDQEGGQRMITRFTFSPAQERWLCAAVRHWHLDAAEPR